jgi:pyruvate dehydrogenase E2 component (dihydrolipoamide acetyltransferase)
MARLLRMPGVAANATEAVLQEWTAEEGAHVSAQEPIATVETEKAVVDIEAEGEGVVLKRLVPAGSQVEVGAPIAVIGEPGEQVDDVDALLAELGVGVETAPPDDPEGGTANTGTGTLPSPAEAQQVAQQVTETNGEHRGRIFSSPLARRLAREAGLAVEEIRGSGPHGRILRRDVEAAVAGLEQPAAKAPYTDIPHTKMRRAIAGRLTESKQTTPHFYLRATIDARRLLRLRRELNDSADVKVSLNDLVVKAVARAHTLVPEMNVTWTPEAVRQYSTVDVAVAVATDRGLLTPVLRDVDSMSLTAVARATKDLAERARAGRLRQEELEGGAISVTNLGMFGTEEFAAIINPPQSAILAVGAVRDEPVARKGRLKVAPVMRVTLSVDHRPVDGVVAARWMQAFVELVERPLRILA